MGINNKNYNTEDVVIDTPKVHPGDSAPTKSFSLAKVFGYMFIALLITAVVAVGVGALFGEWYKNDRNAANSGISIILAISSILTIITLFIINFGALKKGKGVKIGFFIFAGLMGVTLSTLVMFTDNLPIVGIAFGLTSLIFALMWGIAALGKEKIAPLGVVGAGLLLGAGLVALFSWIIILCTSAVDPTLIWVLDFIVFGAIMLITIADIARIQTICRQGEIYDDLAVYCACTLYIDFIYIFVRLATYLLIAYGKSR